MSTQRRRLAALTTALMLLTGCTLIANTPPGTTLTEMQRRHGPPAHICADPGSPDTNQRAIWSQQPKGQHAWAARVNADGRVTTVEPVLTDQAFQRLRPGLTPEDLRCTYGPPALINVVGWGNRQTVWSYRYREAKSWNSLMHIYFNADGKVARFEPGPDPMFEEDGLWPAACAPGSRPRARCPSRRRRRG